MIYQNRTSFTFTFTGGVWARDGVIGGGITSSNIIFGLNLIATIIGSLSILMSLRLMMGLFILREIVHTHALPQKVHHNSHPKQHDLSISTRMCLTSSPSLCEKTFHFAIPFFFFLIYILYYQLKMVFFSIIKKKKKYLIQCWLFNSHQKKKII